MVFSINLPLPINVKEIGMRIRNFILICEWISSGISTELNKEQLCPTHFLILIVIINIQCNKLNIMQGDQKSLKVRIFSPLIASADSCSFFFLSIYLLSAIFLFTLISCSSGHEQVCVGCVWLCAGVVRYVRVGWIFRIPTEDLRPKISGL